MRSPASANHFTSIVDDDFRTFTSEWFTAAINIKSRYVMPSSTVESFSAVRVPDSEKRRGMSSAAASGVPYSTGAHSTGALDATYVAY